jgi:hypothetical protein
MGTHLTWIFEDEQFIEEGASIPATACMLIVLRLFIIIEAPKYSGSYTHQISAVEN